MLQHRARDQFYKRGVGLLFVATLLVLLVFLRVYDQKSNSMKNTFFITATAQRVDGLEVDSKVTAAGLPVGKVRSITLMPDRLLHIRMELDTNVRNLLRQDSVAMLTKPIIGSAIVDLSLGSPDQPALTDGASVKMRNAPDVNDIVATLPSKLAKVDAVMEQMLGLTTDLRADARQLMLAAEPLKATLLHAQAASQASVTAVATLNTTLLQAQSVVKASDRAANEAQGTLQDIRSATVRLGPVMEKLEGTLKNSQALSAELLAASPLVTPALQAGNRAIQDADDVLSAAKRSVFLGGSQPPPALPLLITPRAP